MFAWRRDARLEVKFYGAAGGSQEKKNDLDHTTHDAQITTKNWNAIQHLVRLKSLWWNKIIAGKEE